MFRSAFLGCGPRAKGHARAYSLINRGKMVALCDLNRQRLDAFGEEFGVAARYDDFAKMVETERPDLVHMVTLPALRVPLLTQAVELGVPAVIVEKPLASDADDLAAIAALDGRGTRIVVNHQLRFHPRFLELRQNVLDGRIGPLRHVDGSCASRPTEQGSHVMNLLFALNSDSPPVLVQGGCGGAEGLKEGYHHPAPDNAWAVVNFANGAKASFVCGAGAARCEVESIWAHKRAAAYGDGGHVEWWMHAWNRQLWGQSPESGRHEYGEQDIQGQAGLTNAVFDWLESEAKPHPNRLEVSVTEVSTILAVYLAALERAPIELPQTWSEPLLPRLKEAFGA